MTTATLKRLRRDNNARFSSVISRHFYRNSQPRNYFSPTEGSMLFLRCKMSLLGTKRTWPDVRLESAFGGKAEVEFRGRQVQDPSRTLAPADQPLVWSDSRRRDFPILGLSIEWQSGRAAIGSSCHRNVGG